MDNSNTSEKIRCLQCGEVINNQFPSSRLPSALKFRGKHFCSAKCNNIKMGILKSKREREGREGHAHMWHDSQILDEKYPWKERRGWLKIGDWTFGWSYNLGFLFKFSLKFEISHSQDDDICTFNFALLFFSVWFHIDGPWWFKQRYLDDYENRETGIYWIEDSICWNLWYDTWNAMGRNDYRNYPWWRHFYFSPKDFILGRMERVREEILREGDCEITMPEGTYFGKFKTERYVYKRRRWFTWERISTTISVPDGIPFQGKGENSWDCGDDALTVAGVSGDNVADAIRHFRDTVNDYRKRYGMPSKQEFERRGMLAFSSK